MLCSVLDCFYRHRTADRIESLFSSNRPSLLSSHIKVIFTQNAQYCFKHRHTRCRATVGLFITALRQKSKIFIETQPSKGDKRKGKELKIGKLASCYSAAYMSWTRTQKRFTISEVAVN